MHSLVVPASSPTSSGTSGSSGSGGPSDGGAQAVGAANAGLNPSSGFQHSAPTFALGAIAALAIAFSL